TRLGEAILAGIINLQARSSANAVTVSVISVTPFGSPDGDDAKVDSCTPMAGFAGNPRDDTGFFAGSACGVLKGTAKGAQLATMNAGLPAGMTVRATAATGDDVYAGAQSGGVWRYTQSVSQSSPVTVVEYYNATLDHYFITWVAAEQANLDAGNTPTKWVRTGYSFRAYTTAEAGTSPVCRYYIPPA